MSSVPEDSHVRAFCSDCAEGAFHSVAHRHEVWTHDPFDVEEIHKEPRSEFRRLLDAAALPPGLPYGRILVLLGDSGSGKTHLMRAFRSLVHRHHSGYCGYMQLTSAASDYSRYLLNNLIESLDKSYSAPEIDRSSLSHLSSVLVDNFLVGQSHPTIASFRNKPLDDERVAEFVGKLADDVLADSRIAEINVEVIRAMLYLHRNDPRFRPRVMKYLRCEELPEYDHAVLGNLFSPQAPEPQWMLEQLGRLVHACHFQAASLVLLIDQIEDLASLEDFESHARRVVDTIRQTADNVPSSVIVLTSNRDFYAERLKPCLSQSVLDRLETNPDRVSLEPTLSHAEIESLLKPRLAFIYDSYGVRSTSASPCFPFTKAQIAQLSSLRTRNVLGWCQSFRRACIDARRILVDWGVEPPPPMPGITALKALDCAWSSFQHEHGGAPPDEEGELAQLLSESIMAATSELPDEYSVDSFASQRFVEATVHFDGDVNQQFVLGICNGNMFGAALRQQIEEVAIRAEKRIPVLVRCSVFPKSPTSIVADILGRLIAHKNARVVVAEDSDWRTMIAFRRFHQQHKDDDRFSRWQREERPLTQLKTIREILNVDELPHPGKFATAVNDEETPTVHPVPQPTPEEPVAAGEGKDAPGADVEEETTTDAPLVDPDGWLVVGTSRWLMVGSAVTINAKDLTKHAAFLGTTGSGKSTVALNLIEQLLLQRIPVVLVDRKGDLCRYACPAWQQEAASDEQLQLRKRTLLSTVEVRLYTPGHPDGQDLAMPVIPEKMNELTSHERSMVIRHAASSLGAMMNYKTSKTDQARLVILQKAIEVLADSGQTSPSLRSVIDLVADKDSKLVSSIGRLDGKNCKGLADDLETFRHLRQNLLSPKAEPLDVNGLLGGNHGSGKTRLSIISTKFLGDSATVEFWVSRLLVEVSRWASKHPKEDLQAVILFDEADLYLPAMRKPPTKEPMEHLLKRARSAGLGIFLASQNPGDFDYKFRENIGTWFVGRIKEKNSIDKMKPMLIENKVDVSSKLSAQKTGQFFLLTASTAKAIAADRSALDTLQLPEDEILRLARRTNNG